MQRANTQKELHIAVDIRNVARKRTGSEAVVVSLVRHLIHAQHKHTVTLLTDARDLETMRAIELALDMDGLSQDARQRIRVRSLWSPHRSVWILWSLPRFLRNHAIDVFHTEYIVPFFVPRRVHVATHIHDVSFAVPEIRPMINYKDLIFLDFLIGRSLRRADAIIAVSSFTRDEIIRYYPRVAAKVIRIDNACSDVYIARAKQLLAPESQEWRSHVVRKYDLPQNYIFSLGTMQPRKNITHVMEAFMRIASEMPDAYLVFGGEKAHNFDKRIDEMVVTVGKVSPEIRSRIVFTGYIADEDLPAVYAGAVMCITPSLYEGFGVPILEAMWTDTPVLAADTAVYREVAGVGALYFPVDPNKSVQLQQIDQCAHAIYTVWSDKDVRQRLIAAGRQQRIQYSWDKSGRDFLLLLENLQIASNINMKKTYNLDSQQEAKKSKKSKTAKKLSWRKILVGTLILLLIGVSVVVWRINALSQAVSQKSIWSSIGKRIANEETALKGQDSGRINIALVGMRGYGVVGGGLLADTIMVVSIIKNDAASTSRAPYKITAMSVPRDLLVEGPDGRLGKINAVFFHGEKGQPDGGGIEAMKTVLSKVTGAPIHYGVAVNFEGFSQIVDAMGGVDVDLAKTFSEPLQFNQVHVCDGENGGVFTVPTGETQKKFGKNGKINAEYPLCFNSAPECGGVFTVPAGQQNLTGEQALCYVRSRMTSSDFDRARRQQEVIESLRSKATSLNLVKDFSRLNEILSIVGDNVQFDLELWELDKLFAIYSQLGDSELSRVVLDDGADGYLYAPGESDGYSADYGYILRPRNDSFEDIHALFASFADSVVVDTDNDGE